MTPSATAISPPPGRTLSPCVSAVATTRRQQTRKRPAPRPMSPCSAASVLARPSVE